MTHEELYKLAWEAGVKAGTGVTPQPMHVVEHANPVNDTSPVVRRFAPVMDGVCGFAWINVKPGNSSFAKWLKVNNKARTDTYCGGVTIWISTYNQSYERKYAHACAMAKVLKEHGIRCYPDGRLD